MKIVRFTSGSVGACAVNAGMNEGESSGRFAIAETAGATTNRRLVDTEFLKHWLSLLELYPSFGARPNRAAIAMLLKLIGAGN